MNTLTLFGAIQSPSTVLDWQFESRPLRPVSGWLALGSLLCLAAMSTIVGIMQPELLASVFSEI